MSETMLAAENLIDDGRPPIIIFLGNTGSGKTGVALEMPDSEAISADRFTAWAQMNIGVAKQTEDELARMPHHLVNIFHLGELAGHGPQPGYVHLGERPELGAMRSLAVKAIDNIAARDRIPIIVGGSASTVQEISLGFERKELPDTKEWLDGVNEDGLRRLCQSYGFPFFEYFNPLDAIRRKLYAEFSVLHKHPLPNVYPIGIRHDMYRLIHRVQERLDQMWDEGLPGEVQDLVDAYGWVRPLTEAIGYKEFVPDEGGQAPEPDKVRRAILANTIGFIWSQSKEFGDMGPIRWASSPEHAIEIGRWVIEEYRAGRQAARTLYWPHTYFCREPWKPLYPEPREQS